MSPMPAVRDRVVSSGIDVQAVSRAARTFTGDFYFTHRHDDRTWIALGDVAGKDLKAEETGLATPTVLTAQTFDGLTYTLKLGALKGANVADTVADILDMGNGSAGRPR